jgi:hypothetical protein
VELKKYLIAGGNSTMLIRGCPTDLREKVAMECLNEVEQVGFVSGNRMEMMGGELCVNATLAFASTLSEKGELFTGEIDNFVNYQNCGGVTKVELPLSYRILGNVVLFDGIGFVCVDKKLGKKIDRKVLADLADKYGLPAFGAIVYEGNRIVPYVYVNGVDSFVRETACGSGSIAYALFSGFSEVIQPTGKLLDINIKKDKVVVCGEVEEVLR